jgi:thioredoxin-dependent peroxiredoxin
MNIRVGTKVPEFTLVDHDGNDFCIGDFIGKKNIVIYFYSKDGRPSCTKQACYFRDQYELFTEADAMLIGISSQTTDSHKKFKEKNKLNFTLLSDENNTVRKMFGVPSYKILSGRVTYIIDNRGRVSYVIRSKFNVKKHVIEATRVLREMKLYKLSSVWI